MTDNRDFFWLYGRSPIEDIQASRPTPGPVDMIRRIEALERRFGPAIPPALAELRNDEQARVRVLDGVVFHTGALQGGRQELKTWDQEWREKPFEEARKLLHDDIFKDHSAFVREAARAFRDERGMDKAVGQDYASDMT